MNIGDLNRLGVSRRCCLNFRILERVHLPMPLFLAENDETSRFRAGCGHTTALYTERLHNCERDIRPDEVDFFYGVVPCVVVKRTAWCMKPRNQFDKVLAAPYPASRARQISS